MLSLRRALLVNWLPALALWIFVALVGTLYFSSEAARAALLGLSSVRARFGLGFSMLTQSLAGALLPFLLQRFQGGAHRKTRAAHVPYLMLCFAAWGVILDLFYRFQARVWGENADLPTVIGKLLVDFGLFSPLISMTFLVWVFAFKDNEFSLARTRQFLGRRWFSPIRCRFIKRR